VYTRRTRISSYSMKCHCTPKSMPRYKYPLINTREHRCRRNTHHRRLEVVLVADRGQHHTDLIFHYSSFSSNLIHEIADANMCRLNLAKYRAWIASQKRVTVLAPRSAGISPKLRAISAYQAQHNRHPSVSRVARNFNMVAITSTGLQSCVRSVILC
jgi:hypothetical protein